MFPKDTNTCTSTTVACKLREVKSVITWPFLLSEYIIVIRFIGKVKRSRHIDLQKNAMQCRPNRADQTKNRDKCSV